jgi:predicted MFS family arabinose efflux permease
MRGSMTRQDAPRHDGAAGHGRPGAGVVAAVLFGNAIEFYDFVVYVFFAVQIGHAFFPASDDVVAALASLAVFGAGFVARPVGAIVLGRFADRRGRRPAMLLTIWLITGATAVMALLPTYQRVGPVAAVLVVACRLVQGFSFGGEVGPSVAFLSETAPPHRRGLYCSGLLAGQGLAILTAGIQGTVLAASLAPQQMQDWGWRVPFALAVAAAPFALVLRNRMPETLPAAGAAAPPPRTDVGRVVALSLAILGGTVAQYVCSYLPTYAHVVLRMNGVDAMSVSIVTGADLFVFALLGGWVADGGRRRPWLLGSRLTCGVLAIPLFVWLSDSPSPLLLWLTTLLLTAANAINGGALFGLLADSFAARRRALSISVVYAAGVALFGGSTPFVVAWLGRLTGSPLAPGGYLAATSALAFAALWFLKIPQDSAAVPSKPEGNAPRVDI